MYRIARFVALFVATSVVLLGVGFVKAYSSEGVTPGVSGPSTSTVERELRQASDEINRTLPMMADRDTRADSCLAGPGAKFTYFYTLVNFDAADLDIPALRREMTESLTNGYRTSPEMADFRRNHVEVTWSYRDRRGNFVMAITVDPRRF